ncbi:MAG: Na+:solute symporter [Gammaproteobacteria bacterium]|nr:Na+:solute symporter [Gammaproteobacteria bacterium]
MLAGLDWFVIGAYLVFALVVGLATRKQAGQSRESYFLADRSLPWWWAGTSIAATTFAADTPLAITGIIASRGLSGNWLWLSWLLVHAGVVMFFARRWWRSGVVTDAEFIALRYDGRAAGWLRTFRAALYGLVYNVIILGWVLRAMGKIVQPLFRWDEWAPGLVALVGYVVPAQSALGGPGEAITVILLVLIVAGYSALGGIRGVIRTDLVQFALGLVGSIWLAVVAWSRAGGTTGVQSALAAQYGEAASSLTSLFPSLSQGWASTLGLGAFGFGAYLLVQSYANVPADGGGYLQQRLGTTRNEADAQKAAGLFYLLQYGVRIWPWLMVGFAALALLPAGGEQAVLGQRLGALVASDREMAYPALMIHLLPPGVFGLLIVSLLAAFMSTIDTHFNWGASYVVSDLALRWRPGLGRRSQLLIARGAVVLFAIAAVLVTFQIERIEQAWRWVAVLGAALGVPTILRWLWWRVTAEAELAGAVGGLLTAGGLLAGDVGSYEMQLVMISGVSTAAMLAAIAVGPLPHQAAIERFVRKVDPMGVWPAVGTGRPSRTASDVVRSLARAAAGTLVLSSATVGLLYLGTRLLLG